MGPVPSENSATISMTTERAVEQTSTGPRLSPFVSGTVGPRRSRMVPGAASR